MTPPTDKIDTANLGQKLTQLFPRFPSALSAQLKTVAQREAGEVHGEVMQSLTDAIFSTSQELKDKADKIGKGLLIEEIGNLMADEALIKANQAVIDEVKQVMAAGSLELEALNQVLQANIQVLAAQCYPKAIAQLQSQQAQLKQERESYEAQKTKQTSALEKHEQRLHRISKRLLNENRRVWALRIWAVKELSTNAVFVAIVLFMGLLLGLSWGINAPKTVVCEKGSLCDRLRIYDRKLLY